MASFGWSDEELAYFGEHLSDADLYCQRLSSAPALKPVAFEDVLSSDERNSSKIATSFWKPLSIGNMLSIHFLVDSVQYILCFARELGDRPLAVSDYKTISALAPSVMQTLTFSNKLRDIESINSVYQSAFNEVSMPMLVLDSAFGLVDANAAGHHMVESGTLFSWRLGVGLSARGDQNDATFKRVFHMITLGGHQRAATVLRHKDTGAPYSIVMVKANGYPARVLIFIVDCGNSATRTPDKEHLRKLFNLTKREAEVAGLLFMGSSVSQIADQIGTGREAVRYHLKQLFIKTGVNSQVALVKLLGAAAGGLIDMPGS